MLRDVLWTWIRMNFKWPPMIPNFHLKQKNGELTLPQTSQRKNVAGQKDLGWCKTKVEIKGSVWQANIVFPLNLRASYLIWASEARGRGAFLSPASGLSISSRAPLARLLFTISPKWRACSQASLHSVMKQMNYQSESALIGATNGNPPHSTRYPHWKKYNFISNLTRTRVREEKISYATEKKCRNCQEFNETVKHILSGCPELAEKPYLYWHKSFKWVTHSPSIEWEDTSTETAGSQFLWQ